MTDLPTRPAYAVTCIPWSYLGDGLWRPEWKCGAETSHEAATDIRVRPSPLDPGTSRRRRVTRTAAAPRCWRSCLGRGGFRPVQAIWRAAVLLRDWPSQEKEPHGGGSSSLNRSRNLPFPDARVLRNRDRDGVRNGAVLRQRQGRIPKLNVGYGGRPHRIRTRSRRSNWRDGG